MTRLVIDEDGLAGFRARELAPARLYSELRCDGRVMLVPLPPGIGKSRAAQALVTHALAHDHDLVLYIAPTRAIISELQVVEKVPPEAVVILKPRPAFLCGAVDAEWRALERAGCAALAKETLCKGCPQSEENEGPCRWPSQMRQVGPQTRLVVMTEQYLVLNPSLLVQIQQRAKAERTLVIFDEALFLTTAITRRFTRAELVRFRTALDTVRESEPAVRPWLDGIDFLLDDEVDLTALRPFWTNSLLPASLAVQAAGHRAFGGDFRYLAGELGLLNSPVLAGQWRDGDKFEIVARVDTTDADVAVFGAFLDCETVEERLVRPVTWLLPGIVFRHSRTRIINIADPIGTARSLGCPQHFNRTVDFFIALALRNAATGRRTVFVARKRFLARIKARVEAISAALGRPLTCVLASSGMPFDRCGTAEIALINYGIVGVNSLEGFDALYCVGGYYARADHLNAVYQQSLPPESRMPIGVRMEGRRRRVYAADRRFDTRFHARRAAATHRLLERRVVLQAVGRVRPFTTPAEIILFQCDNLSAELGEIEEFPSLAAARHALGVPTLAQLRRAALGDQIRARGEDGESLRAIAAALQVAPSTASLAARAAPLDQLIASIGAPR